MSKYSIEDVKLAPYFDMELIMNTSQETRLGGDTLQRLAEGWESWMPELRCKKIGVGKKQYLAVWLDKNVEDAIDGIWKTSPSDGYIFNAMAQAMCMSCLNEVIPEIEDAGCAPAPKPDSDLREALEAAGIPYAGDGPSLARRYAVVTNNPFKGACEICFLKQDCPKGQGQSSKVASVVIGGHELERQ